MELIRPLNGLKTDFGNNPDRLRKNNALTINEMRKPLKTRVFEGHREVGGKSASFEPKIRNFLEKTNTLGE